MDYGLLFDVDGTIMDSFDAIYKSLNEILQRQGVVDFTRDELRSLMDYMSFMEIIGYLSRKYGIDDESMGEFSLDYVNSFLGSLGTLMKPFPGAIELVEYLSMKYILGLISYNPVFILERQVSYFSLQRYFKFIRGYEEINGRKRNGIDEFSRIHGIEKRHIAFVGDQPKDIIEAKASGVISIAVTYGVSRRETIEKEHPEFIADSIDELRKIIDEIFPL